MKKRDRRLTPTSTSLVAEALAQPILRSAKADCKLKLTSAGWDEAIDREAMELKADTASVFYLDGEGTSGNKDMEKSKSGSKDIARLIPNKIKIPISSKKVKFAKRTIRTHVNDCIAMGINNS